MSYTPKSDEEFAEESLMADGEYDFEVLDTSDKQSKKGNDMVTLKLNVFESDGSGNHIYDYMTMGNHFGERKFRHAADACGLIDIYESGKLTAADFQGKCGKVIIKKQDGTPDYPLPKNVVSDYVKRKPGDVVATKPVMPKEVESDEIPF